MSSAFPKDCQWNSSEGKARQSSGAISLQYDLTVTTAYMDIVK